MGKQQNAEWAGDYIITVDIFNEGVDIPSINQVVMLRQTQSSIIFIQQLGRGLRKHDDSIFAVLCRLLNWDKDESSTLYGYKYKYGTCPIFITFHKDDQKYFGKERR